MLRRPDSPVRVLHVFGTLGRGGAEMRTLEMLQRLDPHQFVCSVVTLGLGGGDLESVADAAGIAVHRCPLGTQFGRRFMRLLRETNVDVLHSHVHYTSGYLLWMASRAGVPRRIAHFRTTSDGRRRSLRRVVQRSVLRFLIDRYATDILSVSEGAMAQAWSARWRSDPRCRVIFNGLDTTPFRTAAAADLVRAEFGWDPHALVVINVASFHADKNQSRAVEVFAAMRRANRNVRLLLVGREIDSYQAEVRALVHRLSLDGSVVFAGERADVPRLLQASDVLLFPSRREGLPGVVLESCAAGLPVVASDIPGVREIAAHFPNVAAVSLSRGNDVWAARTLRAAAFGHTTTENIDFEKTPFTLPHAVRALCDVYANC